MSIAGGLYRLLDKEKREEYRGNTKAHTSNALNGENQLMNFRKVPRPQSMTGGCSNWWSTNECLRGAISMNVIHNLQINDP